MTATLAVPRLLDVACEHARDIGAEPTDRRQRDEWERALATCAKAMRENTDRLSILLANELCYVMRPAPPGIASTVSRILHDAAFLASISSSPETRAKDVAVTALYLGLLVADGQRDYEHAVARLLTCRPADLRAGRTHLRGAAIRLAQHGVGTDVQAGAQLLTAALDLIDP